MVPRDVVESARARNRVSPVVTSNVSMPPWAGAGKAESDTVDEPAEFGVTTIKIAVSRCSVPVV